MKCTGLNGRDYYLDLKKYIPNGRGNRSRYHLQARELLRDMFKGYNILEEVKLPGSSEKRSALFLDFFIQNHSLALEVHGSQHFEYTPYFHKTKAGFLQAKKRDLDKAAWCNKNEIHLLVLRFDETALWREQIEQR